MKDKIKWPAGNRLDLCIPLRKITVTEEGTQFGGYIPSQAAVVMVYFVGNYASYEYTPRIEDNKLFITDNGELKPGVYAIDVRIQEPERKLRSFRCGELEIVRETKQLALGDFVLDNNITLDADAFIFGEGPSAYEVAVRDGYTGTKAEWLESLRGREGRGIADIVALPTGAFRILLTDGSAYVTPILKGEQGVSITDISVTGITTTEVLCTVTMSDGTTHQLNLPRGEQGAKGDKGDDGQDGRGIQSIVLNADYTLTFNYTDGTSYTTPQSLRGEQGAAGQDGQDGQDGRGISSMALDDDNHLIVSYSDGTTYTTPQSLQGERGVSITDFEQVGESATMCFFNIYYSNGNISQIGLPKGEQGDRGEQGPQGPKGDTVVLGEVGEYKLYNVGGTATDGAMTQDATTKAIAANTGYYECGTAAGTAAKVAVGDNEALYTLQKGGSIKVKMTNANAAASGVTLKIGSSAATPLYYNNEPVSASNTWEAGEVISVYYDGSNYQASNAMGVSDKKVDELIVNRVGEFDETTGNIISNRTTNYTYNNVDGYVQQVSVGTGNTWATYAPIDVTPYYSVDVLFYCQETAGNGNTGTFFTKDDGEIVGERMTNTSGSYRTFIVPEGATKIYITNRRGTLQNAAIRGFIKNTVKDITDRLEERVSTEESFTEYITKDIEPLILGKSYTSDEDVTVDNIIKKVGKNIEQLSVANRIIANSLLCYGNSTYQALVSVPVYDESTTYSDGSYAFDTPAGSGIAKYSGSEETWILCTEDSLIEDSSLLKELTVSELATLSTYDTSLNRNINSKYYSNSYRTSPFGTVFSKVLLDDLTWSGGTGKTHYVISIPIDTEKVTVKANKRQNCIIAFLVLGNTGGTAVVSDNTRHVIRSGEEKTFDIPPRTNNLYILRTNNTNTDNNPEYIYFSTRKDNSTDLSEIVLGNKISKVYKVGDLLNLKDYHEIKGRISDGATAVWDLQAVLTTYRIPVNNINKIEVKANSIQPARIQFITGREESGNASITTVDGRVVVSTDSTVTITVPNDAVYMTVDTCFTNGTSRIPEYIKVTEIKDIKNSSSGIGDIKDIQKGIYRKQVLVTLANTKWRDNLSFLTCTDIHGASSTAKEFVEVKKYYADYINFAVHLGDTVAQNFSNDFTFWHNNGMDDVWNIVGNHDTRANGSWGDAGQEAVYNKFFKDYIDLWGIEKQDAAIDPIACYYHKDFTVRNKTVRILCLDALFVTTAQLDWLDEKLSEAKANDYHVVVFCHYPPGFVFTKKDATISTVYFADAGSDTTSIPLLSTQITNRILAFIATGGNFVMWFNGHRHYDELGYSKRYTTDGTTFGVDGDNVPMTPDVYRIPVITLEKCSTSGYNRHEAIGIGGELNEHSFTFIAIDPVEHTVKWIRYGNNVNSYMKPKNFMCYDYINKTIIGQG